MPDDARRVQLGDFPWQVNDKFTYTYDFGDYWLRQVRVEQVLPPTALSAHPVPVAGGQPQTCTRGGRGTASPLPSSTTCPLTVVGPEDSSAPQPASRQQQWIIASHGAIKTECVFVACPAEKA